MDRFEAAARCASICSLSAGGKLIIVKRLRACYMEKALYKCTTLLYFTLCLYTAIKISKKNSCGAITVILQTRWSSKNSMQPKMSPPPPTHHFSNGRTLRVVLNGSSVLFRLFHIKFKTTTILSNAQIQNFRQISLFVQKIGTFEN